MNSVCILHGADFHIGASSSDDLAEYNIENACRKFFADASLCDAVVLAGDIFDNGNINSKYVDMFLSFVRKCGVPVFYSFGNHDPRSSAIADYCVDNAPENLHIFPSERLECYTLDSIKTRVYGISFDYDYENISLLKKCIVTDDNYINILCIHGDVNVKNSVYNNMNDIDFSKYGFDYVALGHVHSFSGLKCVKDTYYAYPGTILGRGFDECGQKGYICANVYKNNVTVKFKGSAGPKYYDLEFDMSDIDNYSDFTHEIQGLLNSQTDFYRINIVGTNNISSFLDINCILASISNYNVKLTDNTLSKFDPSSYANHKSLLGFCACETQNRIKREPENEELLKKACSLLYELLDR